MLLTTLVLYGALAAATQSPTATTCQNVTYTGVYNSHVEAFLGIRFAHDTSSQRFKPPVTYIPSPGSKIQASDPGPSCPQTTKISQIEHTTPISEDCLRLNVFRPNGTTSTSKLPVMVYVFGGSFVEGSKDDYSTQPGGLILQSVKNGLPVIHASMNYRLGVFGFAQSTALKEEGSENAGLRDQRLALEWVKDNIRAFGGDPDNITIHGQSSGGLSMGMQTLAFGGAKRQVFHRVIPQSQVLENGITGNFTRDAMQRVADATNCNTTDLQSSETIDCLRDLSMKDLLDAELETIDDTAAYNIGDVWLPSVDDDFLPAAPSELIATGRFYNVSMMAGWCEDDAAEFVGAPSTPQDTRNFLQNYLPSFTTASLNNLLSLYPSSDFHDTYFDDGSLEQPALVRIVRDILFVCQPVYLGEALAKAGNDVYFWNQNQTVLTQYLEEYEGEYGYGVIHTSEIAYVFGNLTRVDPPRVPYDPKPADFALRDRESRSWSSFASLGHPSVDGKDTLKGFGKANFQDENFGVFVIGGPNEGYSGVNGSAASRQVMLEQKLRERCAFLNSPEIIKQQRY